MTRRLPDLVMALCLLPGMAVGGLWLRSHYREDSLYYSTAGGREFWLDSARGLLRLTDTRSLGDWPPGWRRGSTAPPRDHSGGTPTTLAEWVGFRAYGGRTSAGPLRCWVVPHGAVFAAALLPAAAGTPRWLRARRRRLRLARGQCPGCGYDVRATPGVCPECGSGKA